MLRVSNRVLGLGFVIAGIGLAGCGAPGRPVPVVSYSTPAVPQSSTVTHEYNVTAVDAEGKPLTGADVAIKLTSKGAPDKEVKCVTDSTGRCEVTSIEVKRDPAYTYVTSYASTAAAVANKSGYYTAKSVEFINDSTKKSNSRDIKLRLIQPLDYLDANLKNSATDKELRGRVLRFLEVIKLQSLLNDGEVMLGGIGTSEFKGKKYLRVRVNSTTVYNSLRLDKYAIGKQLYDETIRKLLNPLNDHIAAPKAYFGYDIVVYGYTKNLTEKYATPTKIEYRFLLPESAVRRYKEKDISGQALLDAGVQLIDDERVEFKLQ
ncbi:hypothetical protein [Massilia sp.]|uniref:hypothetical protein n=1 Tax=Massilia sp. TaxID=1882437 RepID=UPI0028A2B2FD|nr:hypothetical protein [Massilia sp.]